MDAGEDAEHKLGICAFYFSILIFKASDGGYRNGCLRVGWNGVCMSILLLSSQPSGGHHQCPRPPVYSGLLSSHDMEATSPHSPLPHDPLLTLVSSDLSGQDRCFLVLSRGVTNYPGDQGSVWTGERRPSWVSSCISSPVTSYRFCILLLLSVVILVYRLFLFRLCAIQIFSRNVNNRYRF